MRRTDKFTIDTMLCNECHKVMFVPRRLGHKRPMGHIKDMYCPWSRKTLSLLSICRISLSVIWMENW